MIVYQICGDIQVSLNMVNFVRKWTKLPSPYLKITSYNQLNYKKKYMYMIFLRKEYNEDIKQVLIMFKYPISLS